MAQPLLVRVGRALLHQIALHPGLERLVTMHRDHNPLSTPTVQKMAPADPQQLPALALQYPGQPLD